ncbi:outer membrane beta-barrel protein [Rhizosphaericola mali]|uniref:Porin family protein n=1 Tax=Rhizosphaericola mali TaxID=2545455 RepID=A0A5P2GA15_9BACT|nr:outer membrane beta-barrel protein [Rhizosphaericola mali]QES88381.1 porin family protein [Rhizosphaericola mali]
MKKILLAIAIIGSSIGISHAQSQNPSFIGISGGLSLPTGNWNKSNYEDYKSGYAHTGSVWGIDGAYFFSKHIGVGGLINYGTYKNKNLSTISDGYIESYEYSKVAASATRYKATNFLAGLYYNFPIGKLSITARTLAGITHAKTPEITLSTWGDDDTYDGDITQHSASKTTFGLDGGIGLSYPVYKKFSVALRGDYFYSKPNFDPINYSGVNNPQEDARVISKYHEPLAGVNITFGITYSL